MNLDSRRKPIPAKNVPAILGLVFSIIGSVFLVVTLVIGGETFFFLQNAASATGQVVNLVKSGGSRGYAVVVRYEPTLGGSVEGKTTMTSSPAMAQIGETVKVYYDPKNPSEVRLDNFVNLWLLPVIFGSIAFTMLGVGLGFLAFTFFARKSARPNIG